MNRRDFAKTILGTAVAGMLAGTSVFAGQEEKKPAPKKHHRKKKPAAAAGATEHKVAAHDCKGKNDCKGQGGCKTGDAGCRGKNTCKGKGGCKVAAATAPKTTHKAAPKAEGTKKE